MNKKYILIGSTVLLLLTLSFLPRLNHPTATEKFNVELELSSSTDLLADFGVMIDLENTNDTVVISNDEKFHFAFFFNVAISCMASSLPDVYGGGFQPDYWYYSGEVDFTKYGDLETHYLETRMYGYLNVYLDDYCLGMSNFDSGVSDIDTNQTIAIKLSTGAHYITVIAAEYQLPYVGATSDEAVLVWSKVQHVFYVLANVGDPLPDMSLRNLAVDTTGTPYSETFEDIDGFPLENPVINLQDVDISVPTAINIDYTYNVSTDGYHSAEVVGYLSFTNVGDGEVIWWLNNHAFASSLQHLRGGDNFVYICAISSHPDDYGLMYSTYYPTLRFDTIIVKLTVALEITETQENTVYTTETVTETVTVTVSNESNDMKPKMFVDEEASISILPIALALVSIVGLTILRRKNGGKR